MASNTITIFYHTALHELLYIEYKYERNIDNQISEETFSKFKILLKEFKQLEIEQDLSYPQAIKIIESINHLIHPLRN